MQSEDNPIPAAPKRAAWNKGKLIGAKPPLRPKHVWSIRTKLQIEGRIRDLAMFNLAIDSKLRGCDVVALKVDDIAPHGYAVDHGTGRCLMYPGRVEEALPDLVRAATFGNWRDGRWTGRWVSIVTDQGMHWAWNDGHLRRWARDRA
jgi:hypothetical protein